MVATLARIADSRWFQNLITCVIIGAGVLVGVETYPSLVERYETPLHVLDTAILGVFVAEIVIKMGAHGKRPWLYFTDAWNVFDFTIVAAAFLPVDAQYVTVLRLARLLRVLKLVRALPKLQMLVSALLKSIPSMAYVSLLLGLLFYVYGVAAVFLFGKNDPIHFGNLQRAMVSLFRTVTLEDWTDLMYTQMYGCDDYGYSGKDAALCTDPTAMPVVAGAFFISFVLIGTMIVLNLFVGVIMSGMQEAEVEHKAELRARARARVKELPLAEDMEELQRELTQLQETVTRLSRKARRVESLAPPSGDSPRPAVVAEEPTES